MVRQLQKLIPALLLSSILPIQALAAPAGGAPSGERPCHADAVRFCEEHLGNRDAVRACMRENESSLSQQCKDAMQARRQARMQEQQGKKGQQQQSGAAAKSEDTGS